MDDIPATAAPPHAASPLDGLADQLGVTADALRRLGTTPHRDGWETPERDADGEQIGTSVRRRDGSKRMVPGSRRGLTYAHPLDPYAGSSPTDPILIVEGASDTAAGMDLSYDTVGRPSATGGREHLRGLLRGRYVVVVGERDEAGERGADTTACGIADVAEQVRIVYPPEGSKDLRAWLIAGATRAEVDAAIARAEPYAPPAMPGAGPAGGSGPSMVAMADVAPEPVRWLWPDRIPSGTITMMSGDPGAGKSTLSLDIAARVSTGCGWPDRPASLETPGGVVLLTAEDDLSRTVRPRLDAAGADCSRIVALEGTRRRDPESGEESVSPITLREDIRRIEQAIEQVPGCRLVVIDPLSAFVGETNAHRNAEVRGLLAPLAKLAERHDVAVVLIEHLTKAPGGPAVYRSQGSIGIVGAARAAYAVAQDRDDRERVIVAPTKSNLSSVRTGLAYRLIDTGQVARVEWEADPVDTTADEALAPERGTPGPEPDQRSEAGEWLRGLLSYASYRVREVQRMVRDEEWSWRTVQAARHEIGAVSRRSGFGGGGWWTLPGGGDGGPDPAPFGHAHSRTPPPNTNNPARMGEPCANGENRGFESDENPHETPFAPFAQGSEGFARMDIDGGNDRDEEVL